MIMPNAIQALELSIKHSETAGDVNSLAALARQEAKAAERWRRVLAAVLSKTGPVTIDTAECVKDRRVAWATTNFDKQMTISAEQSGL